LKTIPIVYIRALSRVLLRGGEFAATFNNPDVLYLYYHTKIVSLYCFCLHRLSNIRTLKSESSQEGFSRVRKLNYQIANCHRETEGMAFTKDLLSCKATPLQIGFLMKALAPLYQLIDFEAPRISFDLGVVSIPWQSLSRSCAIESDLKSLAKATAEIPTSSSAAIWLEQLKTMISFAPHRFMAHVYIRYGGDLSGGQLLGKRANMILQSNGIQPLEFWSFDQPISDLQNSLREGFEKLELSPIHENELFNEAKMAFISNQILFEEIANLSQPNVKKRA